MPDDRLAAELAVIKDRGKEVWYFRDRLGAPEAIEAAKDDIPRLIAALEALLTVHRIEPLYQHADEGECGCPVPGDDAHIADDVAYDDAHPEGTGPLGTGLVCAKKPTAGHWCVGCADIAVEHGCFTVPKDYPPGKCPVRTAISSGLLTEETSRVADNHPPDGSANKPRPAEAEPSAAGANHAS